MSANKHQMEQENQEKRMQWRMRWYFVIVITISYLASSAISIAILWFTKNPVPLALSSAPLYLMRPMIMYLFSSKEGPGKQP